MSDLKSNQRIVTAPEGYEPSVAHWVWALEDTRQRTKDCLYGVTNKIIDWIPAEGGNSIGTLLYHIVAIELSYLYEDILETGWSEELESLITYDVRDDQGKLTVVQDEGLEDHLDRLDAGRDLFLKAMREMSPDDFHRPRLVEDYEVTPEWVLHHLIQHESEHRGQIADLFQRALKANIR
jgi:uncharacterized damage-inducible protein DinB